MTTRRQDQTHPCHPGAAPPDPSDLWPGTIMLRPCLCLCLACVRLRCPAACLPGLPAGPLARGHACCRLRAGPHSRGLAWLRLACSAEGAHTLLPPACAPARLCCLAACARSVKSERRSPLHFSFFIGHHICSAGRQWGVWGGRAWVVLRHGPCSPPPDTPGRLVGEACHSMRPRPTVPVGSVIESPPRT